METRLGAFVVQSVVMGLIAIGLVLTVSGPPRFGQPPISADVPRPPGFLYSALRLVVYQLGAVVVAVVVFGPLYFVVTGFERWIDIPACQRLCASHGFSFDSFRATKTTYDCVCATPAGLSRFHDRANITGGHGFFACSVDWLFRAGTTIFVAVVWVVGLLVVAVWVGSWKGVRWEGRHRDGVSASRRKGDVLGHLERLNARFGGRNPKQK